MSSVTITFSDEEGEDGMAATEFAAIFTRLSREGWTAGDAAAMKALAHGAHVSASRPPRLTPPHEHQPGHGTHHGWLGHDGYPVHRHTGDSGWTEWEHR